VPKPIRQPLGGSEEPRDASSFDAICEWEFIGTRSGKKVIVRLGRPAFDKKRKLWICPNEIQGLKQGAMDLSRADDPFLALLNGIERFRRRFKAEREAFDSAQGTPYFMFPLSVPLVYGTDVNRQITELVEREIEKAERRSRRRSKDDRAKRRKGAA
jgi:hypothetical protein